MVLHPRGRAAPPPPNIFSASSVSSWLLRGALACIAAALAVIVLASCAGGPAARGGTAPSRVPSSPKTAPAAAPSSKQLAAPVATPEAATLETARASQALAEAEFFARYPDFSQAVKTLYRAMTDEERIGQLLIISLFADIKVRALTPQGLKYLRAAQPGGILLFRRNVQNKAQLSALTRGIVQNSAVRPFVAVDAEGGPVNRLRDVVGTAVSELPSARSLSESKSADEVRALMAEAGAELRGMGITMNLSPVADVRQENTPAFLQERIFGDTPAQSAAYAEAVVRGLQSAGVLSVAKHFPGHGGASGDTHAGPASVEKSLAALEQFDFVPFRRAVSADVAGLMLGHLFVPALDPAAPVAEASPRIIAYLRNNMKFTGIIMTDSLSMSAVKEQYAGPNLAERALNAGVTMLLDPPNALALKKRLLASLANGTLERAAVERAVLLVLRAKESYGLL